MSLTICTISDTHTKHTRLVIPPCDILIHCGDFSSIGRLTETISFMQWLETQPAKYKIFISGNHDGLDYQQPGYFKELLFEYAPSCTYLRDEMIEVEGLKIWGSPWTPEYGNWYFTKPRDSAAIASVYSAIPSSIDILVTHGPAYQILDRTRAGDHAGCERMRDAMPIMKPKYHLFGHIHEASGIEVVGDTTHINASSMNENYVLANKPKIFQV